MAGWKPKYNNVPVEDIRATGITFEQLIMRTFDKMAMEICECSKSETWLSVESLIRFLDSIIENYHDEEYVRERAKIEKFLENRNDWSYVNFKALMDWLQLIASKFGKMDILPEQKISFIAGLGPADEHPEFFK